MSDPLPEFVPPPPPPGTPPPAFQPPPGYGAPPSYQPAPSPVPALGTTGYALPAGYAPPTGNLPPGYAPPAAYAPATYGAAAGISLMSQFTGIAAWSIILGVISLGVPIVTSLTTGGTITFFYVLPIVGLIRGFTAVTRGQVIGGVVGIVLNALGGLISLFASGIL